MKFDTYYIIARIIPTLLAIVPFYIFQYFYLNPVLGEFWGNLMGVKIVANTTFSIALFFFLLQSGRILSKILEKKVFNNGLNFPTTNYLLHLDDTYSEEYTLKIHKKIKSDFNIDLFSTEYEKLNDHQARKLVSEAISHVRSKVKRGRLLGQHNDEYGFVRNLAGLSIISSLMCLINLLFFNLLFQDVFGFGISLVLFFIYSGYALFSSMIINMIGCNYAKILIQEYMAN